MNKIYQVWVKKRIAKKEWSNWYSHNTSYAFLHDEGDTLTVGFCLGRDEENLKDIPEGWWEADYNDLSRIQQARIKLSARPLPLEEDITNIEPERIKEHNIYYLNKMKEKYKNLFSVNKEL